MKSILFYGNCQVGAIKDIMKKMFENYNITLILCWIGDIDKVYFTNKIKDADIIITQPINKNYRNVDYLHTEYILENANPNTQIIIFPSLYFNFYYFDYVYKTLNNHELLREPSDYHYDIIINNYNDKLKIINEINNINYKTKDELEYMAENSIIELEKRELEMKKYINSNCYIINAVNYITNNFKNKLLFYSINHPTKYLFQYISEQINQILKLDNKINYDIDPLLSNERGILYKCIQNVVNFDINNFEPRLNKYNLETKEEIIDKYIEVYKEIDLKSKF